MVNERPITLSLWDTAGQEDYDRLRPLSYAETDVFVVCFSLINPTSLENVLSRWIPELKLHQPNVPILLCGTKADLADSPAFAAALQAKPACAQRRLVDELEARRVASLLGCEYARCSALTQAGLKEVFDRAVKRVLAPPVPKRPPTALQRLARVFRRARGGVAAAS